MHVLCTPYNYVLVCSVASFEATYAGCVCAYLPPAHTHARTHARTHTHIRTHARTHARTHERTHARTHAHTHTHIQTNKHSHTYIHKYIHTYTGSHSYREGVWSYQLDINFLPITQSHFRTVKLRHIPPPPPLPPPPPHTHTHTQLSSYGCNPNESSCLPSNERLASLR